MANQFSSLHHTLMGLLVVGALHSPARAQSEIMVGWMTAASSTATPTPPQPSLIWSTTPALSAAALEDLTDLRDAVAASPLTCKALIVSDNGRSAALQQCDHGDDRALPTGVTVWTDWRVVESVIQFPDLSGFDFLSNNHALLWQRPSGGPYLSFVVDLRRPDARFQFIGYQLASLRVTDSGKWAALTTDGTLTTGQLGAADGSMTGKAVPITGPIRNLIWRKDGRILVIEREDSTLTSYLASNWSMISSCPGSMGPNPGVTTPAGRDSFLGGQHGVEECTFTIDPSGQITSAQWPHQVSGEVGSFVSPTRRFIRTQSRTWAGFMEYFCRKTPDATAGDVIPQFETPPPGSRIQCSGWLAWEP